MKNNKYMSGIVIWIAILVIELFWFYGILHRVHDQEEVYFRLTVIFVTLVVGAVSLIVSAIGSRNRE